MASPLERLAITYTRMIVGFYEPRTTNHGLSSDSDAAFRRDRLKLTTTLRESFGKPSARSGTPSGISSGTSPTKSHTGDGNERSYRAQKKHGLWPYA